MMRAGWFLSVFLSAFLAAQSAPAAAISLEVLRKDGYGSIALKRPRPNVLTVVATIDGKKQALIVDTGWGSGGISLRSDRPLNSRLSGEKRPVLGTSASGQKLSLSGKGVAQMVQIGDVQLTQVPLIFGNFQLPGGEAGAIGGEFLRTCSAIIDLQNLRLYLRPPGKGHRPVLEPALRAAGLSSAPLSVFQNHIAVDVQINDLAGKMVVDTGAEFTALDNSFAEKLKAALYNSRIGFIDAAGHQERSKLAKIHSFKISGTTIQAPGVRFSTLPFAPQSGGKVMGLLGINVLGSNGAIIDYGAQKLYFYGSG